MKGDGLASKWVVSSKERRRISVDTLEARTILEGVEEGDLRAAVEGRRRPRLVIL